MSQDEQAIEVIHTALGIVRRSGWRVRTERALRCAARIVLGRGATLERMETLAKDAQRIMDEDAADARAEALAGI